MRSTGVMTVDRSTTKYSCRFSEDTSADLPWVEVSESRDRLKSEECFGRSRVFDDDDRRAWRFYGPRAVGAAWIGTVCVPSMNQLIDRVLKGCVHRRKPKSTTSEES